MLSQPADVSCIFLKHRTTVTFRSVVVTSPVPWAVRVSAKGEPVLDLTAEFFTPCDYATFCAESRLTADTKVLQVCMICSCAYLLCARVETHQAEV
jgi:hypothetical protein